MRGFGFVIAGRSVLRCLGLAASVVTIACATGADDPTTTVIVLGDAGDDPTTSGPGGATDNPPATSAMGTEGASGQVDETGSNPGTTGPTMGTTGPSVADSSSGGGPPPVCPPEVGDTPCETCGKTECCAEYQACVAVAECDCALTCFLAGTDTEDCLLACGASAPALDLFICAAAVCDAVC